MSISNRAKDSVVPLFKKPQRSRRKHKLRKRRSPRIHREIFEGPFTGFSLTYNRDHPIFPRQWIWSLNGILLKVARGNQLAAWNRLVKINALSVEAEEGLSPREADRVRSEYLKSLKREVYWDDAKKYFRK